jgi:hypothetical protein
MQTPERRPPPAILLDSSIGDDIGQVLALALLLSNETRREARLTSLSVSRNNLRIAAFCDLLARFLGGPLSIGVFADGNRETAAPPMISAVLEKQSGGKALYARGIEKWNDTADPVALIRNALTAQPDQNSTIVLAGPPANLLGLLALPGSRQLVEKKVRVLIAASSALTDASGFGKLLAAWPTPVLFARESDHQWLRFPAAAIESDFAWAPNHPLVDAYRSAGAMPYDAPAAVMAAALHAVRPKESFFSIAEAGSLKVQSGGELQFQPDPAGRHRRLNIDAGQKEAVLQILRQFVSAKPPAPRPGPRGAQP